MKDPEFALKSLDFTILLNYFSSKLIILFMKMGRYEIYIFKKISLAVREVGVGNKGQYLIRDLIVKYFFILFYF